MAYEITQFETLTDGATVNWDCGSNVVVSAKLTSTQSFTINMTNVLDGAQGVLKIIKDTASDVVITFDADFTNKSRNTELLTYTLSGDEDDEFFLSFIADGTSIEWVISSNLSIGALPFARVTRTAAQSINNNTATALSFDTEVEDESGMYSSGSPTRLTVQGSGNKIASISCFVSFALDLDGIRRVSIYKNGTLQSLASGGTAITTLGAAPGTSTEVNLCCLISCAAGDYFELFVHHVAGAALNVTGALTIQIFDR